MGPQYHGRDSVHHIPVGLHNTRTPVAATTQTPPGTFLSHYWITRDWSKVFSLAGKVFCLTRWGNWACFINVSLPQPYQTWRQECDFLFSSDLVSVLCLVLLNFCHVETVIKCSSVSTGLYSASTTIVSTLFHGHIHTVLWSGCAGPLGTPVASKPVGPWKWWGQNSQEYNDLASQVCHDVQCQECKNQAVDDLHQQEGEWEKGGDEAENME